MSTDSEAASAPAGPSGPTGRLATWLAEAAAKDIPERVRERATAHAHTVEVNGPHLLNHDDGGGRRGSPAVDHRPPAGQRPTLVRRACGHLRPVSTAENEAIVMHRAQERRPSTRRGRGAAPPGPRS